MDIPIEWLCNYFECYDTEVERMFLNTNAQYILKKLGYHSDVFNFAAFIKMVPMTFFFSIFMIGQIGHLIHYSQHNPYDFFEVADDIAVIVTTLIVIYGLFSLGSFEPKFTEIVVDLGKFDDPIRGKPPGVEAFSKLFGKYVNFMAILFACFALLTFVYYVLNKCEPDEVSLCGFIFIPYLPYVDIYNKPSRQIHLCLQCLSSYSGGYVILLMLSQYIFVYEIIILKYKHLESIIKLMPTTEPNARRALLRRIVQYHIYLLDVVHQINGLSSGLYTLHLTGTPIAMSMILYQLMGKAVTLPSAVHLGTYVFITTLTCVSGERLTTNAEKIYDTIVCSIPMDHITIAKDMKLLLLQAKKPVVILAAHVTPMNHLLMREIYKTVWSILTLINATKKE